MGGVTYFATGKAHRTHPDGEAALLLATAAAAAAAWCRHTVWFGLVWSVFGLGGSGLVWFGLVLVLLGSVRFGSVQPG